MLSVKKGRINMKIMGFSIVLMILCSVVFANDSGFFMTLDLTEKRMKKLEGVSVKVEPLIDYFVVKIDFSSNRYHGINEIILEKRDGDQQLLLSVPIACKKKQNTYYAELSFSKTQMVGSKILIYFSRDAVKGELERFYKQIPNNLFGICYKANLENLKQITANKPDAGDIK
jgi:hypothetical protein